MTEIRIAYLIKIAKFTMIFKEIQRKSSLNIKKFALYYYTLKIYQDLM